jgi:hypothetical protein
MTSVLSARPDVQECMSEGMCKLLPFRNCTPFACHYRVQELCQHPQVKAHILDQLTAVGKAGKLRGFELVKAIQTGQHRCLAAMGLQQ